MKKKCQKIGDLIYRIRYLLALLVFALCIVFELSGSSIGMWEDIMPQASEEESVESGVIFGSSRSIRSDEWVVNTSMTFSQYFNYPEAFPEISDTLRGTDTDVFIVYGQPIRSWKMIFRPFQIGYLFLSPAKGLSFFWCGRLIALFMVSFELGMVLLGKRKGMALAYAVLMSFSPLVQWWFAINSLVEMLVFGQGALLLGNAYLSQKSYLKKALLVLGVVWCGGSFALTLYPAWQIPILYIILAVAIGIVLKNRRNLCWSWKKDLPLLAAGLVVLGASLGVILLQSWDTIQSVMGTVYPGTSAYSGGMASDLDVPYCVSWAANVIYPLHGEAIGASNVCEYATMLCFFPMGLVLSLWLLLGKKKRDPILVCLLLISVFLTMYALFPWPELISKITFLSHCQGSRVYPIAGLAHMLLLFYALQFCEFRSRIPTAVLLSFLPAAVMCCWNWISLQPYFTVGEMVLIEGITAIPFVMLFLTLIRASLAPFLATAAVLALISGIPVNPLRTGVDVVYEQQVVKDIREVVAQDIQQTEAEGEDTLPLWITDGFGSWVCNVPIMAGAPSINCTNIYPVLERWALLDPDGSNENIYNRYAHILITLQNTDETGFEQQVADSFTVNLNVDDLETLGVEHVFTNRQLTGLDTENVSFRLKTGRAGYFIYDVVYADQQAG